MLNINLIKRYRQGIQNGQENGEADGILDVIFVARYADAREGRPNLRP